MHRTILDGVAWYRPYLFQGGSFVNINGKTLPSEIPARLTLEQWAELDKVCGEEFKARTPVTQALLKHGLEYTLPERQGLAKMVYDERVEDATVLLASSGEQPTYRLTSLPLSITNHEFIYPYGSSDPYVMARAVAHRVGDAIEQTLLLGREASPPYAVQGFCNHAARFVISDVDLPIATALDLLQKNNYYGPYGFITGHSQDHAESGTSLIKGVVFAVYSPHLAKRCMVLFQLTTDVCRIVVGQSPIAIQWEDQYKFLAIVVPQLRTDVHGCLGVADITQE